MVGRRVLLRVEKGAGRSPARPCSQVAEPDGRATSAACAVVDDVSLRRARRRDRRHRRRRRQRPVRAARGARRHPPRRVRRGRARRRADRRRPASPIPASCATRGLAHVPEDRHRVGPGAGLRGVRERDPRLSRRAGATATARSSTIGAIVARRRATRCEHYDVRPRATAPEDRQFLRRQPAEDRAGARDGARPERAARRPADARRRHRRHRVHPPAAHRACATPARRSCWSRSSSTRSCSLSDRILVMFAGRIVGERGPARPTSASSAC